MGNTCCETNSTTKNHLSSQQHIEGDILLDLDDTIQNIKKFAKANSKIIPNFPQRRKNNFGSIVVEKSPQNIDNSRKLDLLEAVKEASNNALAIVRKKQKAIRIESHGLKIKESISRIPKPQSEESYYEFLKDSMIKIKSFEHLSELEL